MVAVAERRPDDEQLGERAGAGDAEAFARLYDRHVRVVGDDRAAADVVYTAFTTAWDAMRTRRSETVRACLYTAAYRAAVDEARRRARPAADVGAENGGA